MSDNLIGNRKSTSQAILVFIAYLLGAEVSYGQMYGLITLPLCTLMGAVTGFSTAVACAGKPVSSIVCLLLVALIGWQVVASMWNSQIAEYGRDPSELVLFFPPTAMCMIALVVAGFIALARIIALFCFTHGAGS